ncbi:MAG: hypothetical protein AAF968_17580 [Pseudomonadota bacterium]
MTRLAARLAACLAALVFLLGPLTALSQMRQIVEYPSFRTEGATLAGAVTGARSGDFDDVLMTTAFQDHVPRDIIWYERGNRGCALTLIFRRINNQREGRTVDTSRCNGSARAQRVLRGVIGSYELNGMRTGMAVCLNNARIKGFRFEIVDIAGERVELERTPLLLRERFIPEVVTPTSTSLDPELFGEVVMESPLGGEPGGAPGQRRVFEVEERTSNCRPGGWTDFARCNPLNRQFRTMIVGFRVYYEGELIRGVEPYCGLLIKAPPGLTRPEG